MILYASKAISSYKRAKLLGLIEIKITFPAALVPGNKINRCACCSCALAWVCACTHSHRNYSAGESAMQPGACSALPEIIWGCEWDTRFASGRQAPGTGIFYNVKHTRRCACCDRICVLSMNVYGCGNFTCSLPFENIGFHFFPNIVSRSSLIDNNYGIEHAQEDFLCKMIIYWTSYL